MMLLYRATEKKTQASHYWCLEGSHSLQQSACVSAELVVTAISTIVDSFIRNDLLGDCLVDMPRMVAAWSDASLARDPSDSVVLVVAHEDSFVVTTRISLDVSVVAMK